MTLTSVSAPIVERLLGGQVSLSAGDSILVSSPDEEGRRVKLERFTPAGNTLFEMVLPSTTLPEVSVAMNGQPSALSATIDGVRILISILSGESCGSIELGIAQSVEQRRDLLLLELDALLEIPLADMSPEQLKRTQAVVALLNLAPLYTPEKYPYGTDFSYPPDPLVFKLTQGDIIYVQYKVASAAAEETVECVVEGYIANIPAFGESAIVTMSNGEQVNLNFIREIIVNGGANGHFKNESYQGAVEPHSFLRGGLLQRDLLAQYPDGHDLIEKNLYGKLCVDWPGIDLTLPVKFIWNEKRPKKDSYCRMTGEKIVVLEAPGEQNHGVLIGKRLSDGAFSDHDMVDIKRVYPLGKDPKVAQLKTHLFQVGDRVVVRVGAQHLYGVVDRFVQGGHRMLVRMEKPPDPLKPFITVKFSSEVEGVVTDVKNQYSKDQIYNSFRNLIDLLGIPQLSADTTGTTLELDPRWIAARDTEGELKSICEKIKEFYDVCFGVRGIFFNDDFNVAGFEDTFFKIVGIRLEDLAQDGSESKTIHSLIRAFMSDQHKEDILREYHQITFVIRNFSGHRVANTGTTPWVTRVADFVRVMHGKLPQSDFTQIGLLKYFHRGDYTFEDRLRLAYKIANARERDSLMSVLRELSKRFSGSSDLEAFTELRAKLTNPDDVEVFKYVLGSA